MSAIGLGPNPRWGHRDSSGHQEDMSLGCRRTTANKLGKCKSTSSKLDVGFVLLDELARSKP